MSNKIQNVMHANAVLIDVAHLALESGLFKSFEQTALIGEAVMVSDSFIKSVCVDPMNKDFRPKSELIDPDGDLQKGMGKVPDEDLDLEKESQKNEQANEPEPSTEEIEDAKIDSIRE